MRGTMTVRGVSRPLDLQVNAPGSPVAGNGDLRIRANGMLSASDVRSHMGLSVRCRRAGDRRSGGAAVRRRPPPEVLTRRWPTPASLPLPAAPRDTLPLIDEQHSRPRCRASPIWRQPSHRGRLLRSRQRAATRADRLSSEASPSHPRMAEAETAAWPLPSSSARMHRQSGRPRRGRLRTRSSSRAAADAGHELDASSLGIAEETLLAGIVPIQRPASVPPTAVRAGEGEVVNLRHLSSVTARPARCRSLRREASRDSAGPRPERQRPRGPRSLPLRPDRLQQPCKQRRRRDFPSRGGAAISPARRGTAGRRFSC